MIHLNEYPKEELETLYRSLIHRMNYINLGSIEKLDPGMSEYNVLAKWCVRIREAISDQEFKEKELPFKTE